MIVPVAEGVAAVATLVDEIALLTPFDEFGVALANGASVLAHPVRRRVLATLSDREASTREELAERVVDDERVDIDRVGRANLHLHHNHLPKLDDHGYVEYDPRQGDVVLWKDSSAVRALLRSE